MDGLAVINGAVDIYGLVWATMNGSMDIHGLWISVDMFGLPLMGPWTLGMGQVLFIQI